MKDILQMMAQIEDDVAQFYTKLHEMKALEKYDEIFKFMSIHSQHHSKTLHGIVDRYNDTPFNKSKYLAFVNKLKANLLNKLHDASDQDEISSLLEEAEGLLGYAYEQIAKYMKTRAEIMLDASQKIQKIAEEEYIHKSKVKEIGSKNA